MIRSRYVRAAAAVLALALVAGACGDDDDEGTSDTTGGDATESTEASAGDGDGDGGLEFLDDAIEFVGGTEGPAEESEPVRIGYVNQQGGALSFDGATLGVETAVDLLNTQMGGIDGHPVELVSCYIQAEEDGQKCATEMLNDDGIQFVMMGMNVIGGESFYATMNQQKPVFILNPVSAPDYGYSDGYAFSGGVPGGYIGIAKFIGGDYLDPKPEKVAVVTTNNPAGVAAINGLVVPTLNSMGITDVTIAQVSDTATGPEIASAVQASGADSADTVLVSLQASACVPAYEALQDVAPDARVVTTNLCYSKPVADALDGEFPEGWYFAGLGWNPYLPADPEVEYSWAIPLTLEAINAAGATGEDPTGPATYTFGPILTTAKLLNELGFDGITSESVRAAISGYTGHLLGSAGDADCDGNDNFPSVCGAAVGFQQYVDGEWKSIADGYNGDVISAW